MKATLSFDLNDPQDRLAHSRAVNGTNAYIVLFNVFNTVLRKRIKYEELSSEVQKELESIREDIVNLCEEYNINLNDLE